MSTFEGARAIDEIARQWALHDGRILSITARVEAVSGVRLELVCSPRRESSVAELRILFSEVTRLELRWSEDQEFYFVSGYKALIQSSGMVYFSLDPYDDTVAAIDPRDSSVIEAHGLLADFVMKSG